MTIDDGSRGQVDRQIWAIYEAMKSEVLRFSEAGQAEECMSKVFDLWMFMNRFRNCDLQFYFDEDLHEAISVLNANRFDVSDRLRPRKEFRIAFIITGMVDTGGASVPHRFMLEEYAGADAVFRQYVLVSNFRNLPLDKTTEIYRYLRDEVQVDGFEYMQPEMGWLEKGKYIEQWLYKNEIDFVVAAPCPATIFALASRPTLIQAILSQDCYTFTIGPGVGDFTFLVTTDQAFKYKLRGNAPEKRLKIVMLPLHSKEFVDKTVPLSRDELGVPGNAIISGSTNMWKTCFGDSELLLEGIAELVRRHSRYHHVFAGTPRCLDNVEAFLAKNADVRENIHFIGPVKNIYRLLKAMDFWLNSFPTSGGSDIESALAGKPTIEFLANRNLNLHGAEFLRSRECDVVSLDEFVALGERFIIDSGYRDNLGAFLKNKIEREFDKESIVKERIYGFFLQEFRNQLDGVRSLPGVALSDTIEHEKRIGLYNIYGSNHWSYVEKKAFLETCRKEFPNLPFAWVKSFELALVADDMTWASDTATKLAASLLKDHRVQTLLALVMDRLGNLNEALGHADTAMALAKYDEIPARVCARLQAKAGLPAEAVRTCRKISELQSAALHEDNVEGYLATLPADELPLYYNY